MQSIVLRKAVLIRVDQSPMGMMLSVCGVWINGTLAARNTIQGLAISVIIRHIWQNLFSEVGNDIAIRRNFGFGR